MALHLKHETLKTGLVKEKDYERIVDPKKMIYPHKYQVIYLIIFYF